MTNSENHIEARLLTLEYKLRRQRLLFIVTLMMILALVVLTSADSRKTTAVTQLIQDSTIIIKARGLIIQDKNGVDRIILGAPTPDAIDGKRMSEQTGMVINDPKGYERFGLGIDLNDRLIMGFDAPPGQGDDRNRERINIATDEYGGAMLRFLNRKTQVVSRMYIDNDDNFFLEYVDWKTDKVLRRKISFDDDETVEWK